MISITHFTDRDSEILASISPRRYFCTQCHVPQHNVRVPVENDFVDIDRPAEARGPPGSNDDDDRGPAAFFWQRTLSFALKIWDVLRRPSSIFSLGDFWCWPALSPKSFSGAPSIPRWS